MYAGVPTTCPVCVSDPVAASMRARDAEVGDERLPVAEQDVLGLDVAMDDAVPVRVVERERDLARDPERVVDGSWRSRVSRSRSDSPSTNGMVNQSDPPRRPSRRR